MTTSPSQPNKDHRIILIVVCSLAALAACGVVTMCACVWTATKAENSVYATALITALITNTASLIGALTSILVNAKSQPQQPPPQAGITLTPPIPENTTITTEAK